MQLWLIPILPFLGFAINGLFGKRLPKTVINAVAVGSVFLSFLWVLKTLNALGAFSGGLEETYTEHLYTWIKSGSLDIGVDFAVDRLTAMMLMIVTGIGTLIHLYATGYMEHESGYYRFFAYLNLFMFFMLILVLGGNFLLLFVGWEGVGLCSYLLIGFYFLEKFATDAGNKAFIVNRVGDFGLSLAMFLIVINFNSLDFKTVFSQVGTMPVETSAGVLTAISLLLLVGACGKSAQIPLYVWLPDAMAGPTPVSALIHAATMVTAGVYMIARSSTIFLHSYGTLDVVAVIGLATAFFAATIGLTQFDIKKVYAYSTVSQLGFMFLGLGVGAFSAGMFHVMTHAFFKALLFLGAGSVIMGCHHEQDMRKMGGLRKYMPITFVCLLAATLAISGVPFLSGAASKDLILEAAYEHAPWMYWVGVLTACMTAFYCSRAFFMTFFGEYKGNASHGHDAHGHDDHGHDKHAHAHTPHESPLSMTIPLMILAVLSVGGQYVFNIPHILEPLFPIHEGEKEAWLELVASAAGIIGIALAYVFYVLAPGIPDTIVSLFSIPYKWIYNKYYVDELYDSAVIEPTIDGSRNLMWRVIDVRGIDGIANGVATVAQGVGGILRKAQSGYIRNYAAWVVAGAIAVIVYVGLKGGVQ
ncbi:MAG: NADH-quinone oxidoreductase subunit L [Bryobacteraceae bacterium]